MAFEIKTKSMAEKSQRDSLSSINERFASYVPNPKVAWERGGAISSSLGKDGKDGKTIVSGQVDPTIVETGSKEGDLFLNTVNGALSEVVKNATTGVLSWVKQINSIIGVKGDTGDAGNQGIQGIRGTSIVSGQVNPVTVETGFIEGDIFLNTVNGKLFELVSNAQTGILEWIQKIQTIFGDKGDAGKSIYNGDRNPNSTDGNNDDSWFNVLTKHIWKKISGIWTDQGLIVEGEGVTTNIGIIIGNKIIDLSVTSKDQLFGTLMGNSVITFTNSDEITNLNLELVIGTIVTSLSVGDVTVDLRGYGVGDKIYLEVKTINSGTTWSVKKNEGETLPVTLPQNFSFVGISDTQIKANWKPPLEGALPVTFDLAYSTSPSEDDTGIPNGADVIFVNGITDFEKTISELIHSTAYYGWLKAKNNTSESAWIG